MLIQRLIFQVQPPEFSKDYLKADSEVWNPWLQRQPGFLKKDTTYTANGQVTITNFWRSAEDFNQMVLKQDELAKVGKMMENRSPGTARLITSMRN